MRYDETHSVKRALNLWLHHKMGDVHKNNLRKHITKIICSNYSLRGVENIVLENQQEKWEEKLEKLKEHVFKVNFAQSDTSCITGDAFDL